MTASESLRESAEYLLDPDILLPIHGPGQAQWERRNMIMDHAKRLAADYIERQGQSEQQPVAAASMRCRFGWHQWGKWTPTTFSVTNRLGMILGTDVGGQCRECTKCGVERLRRV